MKQYVHTHVHTDYSLLDGQGRIHDYIARAKELGMTSLAITDHNHLAGIRDFNLQCQKANIKPLLGCEMYYTEDTKILSLPAEERTANAIEQAKQAGFDVPSKVQKFDKEGNPEFNKNGSLKMKKATKKDVEEFIAPYEYITKQFHILFIAKNNIGLRNLIKLQSEASSNCTYNGRYLTDLTEIKKHSEGLICTTACLGSYLHKMLKDGKMEKAEKYVTGLHDIFGDDLYLELQPLEIQEQQAYNIHLIELSKKFGIQLVTANDCHYVRKEDKNIHDVVVCMGTGKEITDPTRMIYSHDFWLRSYDEMIEAFERQTLAISANPDYMDIVIEAMNNTNKIADKVQDKLVMGSDKPLYPDVKIPALYRDFKTYLYEHSFRGLFKYLSKHPECNRTEYIDRLTFELTVINDKGFAPYFICNYDIVDWCRKVKIAVGPGRGSAAGSLLTFSLGVTKVDPLKHDLLFFRFMTPDRTALPDIDLDYAWHQRGEVIQHLKETYGVGNVSSIGTITRLGVKNGFKDVARVFGVNFGESNSVTKQLETILDKDGATLEEYEDLKNEKFMQKEYKAWCAIRDKYVEIFKYVKILQGSCRNLGVHASGLLVTPMPITDFIPTRVTKEGAVVALFEGPVVEDMNFVKLDVLGLKTLSVLDIALKRHGMSVYDLYDLIDIEDPALLQYLNELKTEGIFQFESNLFKSMTKGFNPDMFRDLVAISSCARPGPLNAGMDKKYSSRKHDGSLTEYPFQTEASKEILKDTYGTIIYQEQVMLLAKEIAHFDDNQSDTYLRKSLAKKKRALVLLCRQWFIYGKINTIPPEGYDIEDDKQAFYDPECKYGKEILGGIANGYDEDELNTFFDDIEGYASYLFNKSHAVCYSFVTMCTLWVKHHYKSDFYAALLSIQEKPEVYIAAARDEGMKILPPNINKSKEYFSVDEETNEILFGLNGIKGIGTAKMHPILDNQPYTSLENALEKVPKKYMNKVVIEALIKTGAFRDIEEGSRNALWNKFAEMRKFKDWKVLNEEENLKQYAIYEKELLGSPVSMTPWWERQPNNTKFDNVEFKFKSINPRTDKKGNNMLFAIIEVNDCDIEVLMFASFFAKVEPLNLESTYTLKGRRDGDKILASSIKAA